jgi:hypothetical protein
MQAKSRYTNDEIAAIQKKFSAAVGRERLFVRTGVAVLGITFVGGLALLILVPGGYKGLIILFLGVVLVIALFVMRRQPPLKCPGCKKELEQSLENYCPECGSQSLRKISRLEAHCATCNRNLKLMRVRGRGSILARRFKIRACTHCGVTLSRSGI